MLSTHKLNGKLRTENFKVLSSLIMRRKCSTMTKLGLFMVSLCHASPEKLSLNWMSQSLLGLSYFILLHFLLYFYAFYDCDWMFAVLTQLKQNVATAFHFVLFLSMWLYQIQNTFLMSDLYIYIIIYATYNVKPHKCIFVIAVLR